MNFSRIYFKRYSLLFSVLLLSFLSLAQKGAPVVNRVDPPNWWAGMTHNRIELLFNGSDIQQYSITLEATNTTIEKITLPPNKNYMIVEVVIGENQKPEDLRFLFKGKKKKPIEFHFPILSRDTKGGQGIDANDLMYMIFPDRFSNGDTRNDAVTGMNETTCDRTNGYARHGGDVQGIINHLDYLDELGIKSLWINPLVENNQPKTSYHGYAATDLYKIDPRFGSNELYKSLNAQCHQRGIKVVTDVVYNHWGNEHHLYKDIPDSNWFHWFPKFTKTNYRAEVLVDPYASLADKTLMSDGWFDKHMPDLNQRDPHLAKYLIQNSIWWVEYAGVDAYRIDTYAYPDQKFMSQLNDAIRKEYPNFVLFGETWVQGSPVQAYFTEANGLNKEFSSHLQSVTDFQLYYAITKGLNEPFGWEESFRRIQMTLSHDVLYKDPYRLVTFLDNHDLSRFYSVIGEDDAKFKMGIALLYTLRGIPCIYYGTEILMKNFCDPDSKVREDFQGGWQGDASNKFIAEGRTEKENETFNFVKTLGQWRKNNAWFGLSKLTQFVPEENTYVYFRHDGAHTVMCVYNGNDKETILQLDRFAECIKGKPSGLDIITGQRIKIDTSMILAPKSVRIIELY